MKDAEEKETARGGSILTQSVEAIGRQNPLLYVILVLIMGGNGFDVFSNTSIRDEVRDISTLLNNALQRLDEEERLSDRFLDDIRDLEGELDSAESRIDSIEARLRRLEIEVESQ